MKSIVFITDVWTDGHANGVVTWLVNTKNRLEQQDFKTTVIHPGQFTNIPLPNYPEIKLAVMAKNKLEKLIREAAPDYICLVTEGPLGLAARQVCINNNWKFTSFYHTRLPEYVYVRFKAFKETTYDYLRWFHKASSCTMVGAQSIKDDLTKEKFSNLALIPMGVDLEIFKRNENAVVPLNLQKPIFTFLGRVAPEKNLEAFLSLDLPGSKLIIGDGPAREKLEKKYGEHTAFVGYKKGQELVDLLSVTDVFVFPSKTDTFGLTMVEALACGVPVAAYDVTGPKDIVTNGVEGYLGEDLGGNALKALKIDRAACIKRAQAFTWDHSIKEFIAHIVPVGQPISPSSGASGIFAKLHRKFLSGRRSA